MATIVQVCKNLDAREWCMQHKKEDHKDTRNPVLNTMPAPAQMQQKVLKTSLDAIRSQKVQVIAVGLACVHEAKHS